MTQTADPQPPRPEADEVRQQLAGKHACPFCGVIRVDANAPCPRCTMEDTPATRTATRQRIGPWFVLQARNPSAPGMKFGTLVSLVKKNHVTPRSIVRGPTTHQLWTFAAQVRGLSREFGLCFSCGQAIDRTATVCANCDRTQEPPNEPDALLESNAPEMAVSSQTTTNDTGMDGGTSLDLQADAAPMVPRAPRPASPQPLARINPRPSPNAGSRELTPANAKEESILTARELAAAFQLDFKAPTARKPRKPMGPVKVLVSLIVIAGIAAAIIMTMRPEWRDQSLAWANSRWSQLRKSLEQPATPKPAAPDAVAKAPAKPTPKPQPTPAAVVAVKPAPQPAPVPEPVVEAPTPVPTNVVIAPKPVDVTPPPVPIVETPPPVPTPKPEPVAPVPIPVPIPASVVAPAAAPAPIPTPAPAPTPFVPTEIPPNLTIDQAISLASDWRNQAIDAEVKKDWSTAIHLYEQIQNLPHDAWPGDLQLRLDAARRKAGS